MKKVIERMNAGVVAEQKASGTGKGGSDAGKKRWFGGVVRKVTGGTPSPTGDQNNTNDSEGMRVDMYLVVFLKFIASIVPTIEVDSTTAF